MLYLSTFLASCSVRGHQPFWLRNAKNNWKIILVVSCLSTRYMWFFGVVLCMSVWSQLFSFDRFVGLYTTWIALRFLVFIIIKAVIMQSNGSDFPGQKVFIFRKYYRVMAIAQISSYQPFKHFSMYAMWNGVLRRFGGNQGSGYPNTLNLIP